MRNRLGNKKRTLRTKDRKWMAEEEDTEEAIRNGR